MGITNFKRALIIALVAILSASAFVACGPKGKRNSRVDKSIDPGAQGKGDGGGAGAEGGGTDGEAPNGEEADATGGEATGEDGNIGGEALNKNAETIKQIESTLSALTETGSIINKDDLEDGTYKLTSIASSLKYMLQTDDSRALQVLKVSSSAEGTYQLSEDSHQNVGLINDTVASRTLEVATSFKVKKEGSKFAANRDAFTPVVLQTSIDGASMKITSTVVDSRVEQSATEEGSFIDMLKNTTNSEGKYTFTDTNKKQLVMELKKLSDTEVRAVINVVESEGNNEDQALVTRTIVLTYSLEKAEQADPLILSDSETSSTDIEQE